MKVTSNNVDYIEIEDGDTVWDLYDRLRDYDTDELISWVPLGHNRPAIMVKLSD